jgi:hypothetical protein
VNVGFLVGYFEGFGVEVGTYEGRKVGSLMVSFFQGFGVDIGFFIGFAVGESLGFFVGFAFFAEVEMQLKVVSLFSLLLHTFSLIQPSCFDTRANPSGKA